MRDIFESYEFCLREINKFIDERYYLCDRQPTIRGANRVFNALLEEGKRRVFNQINTMDKPYIIYRVNRYYYNLTKKD